MAELDQITSLWKEGRAAGADLCLATIVRTEGSSYRKAGTRMLLCSDGRRAGTISGGCLEAEVQKKAWWLTEDGPSVQRYSSFFDDDTDVPYGLGCGGTVWLLLERGPVVDATLAAIVSGAEKHRSCAIGIAMESGASQTDASLSSLSAVTRSPVTRPPGTRLILSHDGYILWADDPPVEMEHLLHGCLRQKSDDWEQEFALFGDYIAAPQRLFLFGAGDDAQPVAAFAAALGWQVIVLDGRANLATSQRFPSAREVRVLPTEPETGEQTLGIGADDAVVVMTHSYTQDHAILQRLRDTHVGYLGVLGPRQRTRRLMQDGGPAALADIHSPIGLKIGARGPAEIALAIIAEIQSVMSSTTENRLSEVTVRKSSAA